MYRSHWGLREIPFRSGVDNRFVYESPSYEEALVRLHSLVDDHHRLGMLVGVNGSGKSLLLEILDRQLRRQAIQVVHLSLNGTTSHDFLWCIAADLGMNPDRAATESELWHLINDGLETNNVHDQDTVFLLDDVDEAAPTILENVAKLIDHVQSADARLTFVIAATSQQNRVRNLPARLLSQVESRIDLQLWDETDTANYILSSLRQVGVREIPFSIDALKRLHYLSQGVPRRISQLANIALLTGAARCLDRIEAEHVDVAWDELSVPHAA